MNDSSKKSLSEVEVQDNVAGYYVEKRYKGYGLKYHTEIIKEMMEGIDGNILDVGCGTGIIHDLYPMHNIIGIDVSEGMLAHHKGVCQIASADNLPFPDNFFDSVVCRSVLHHLPDCEKALREIRRVLRPGGRFVCWETNKSFLAEFIRKLTQHGDHFSDYHHSFSNLPELINNYFYLDEIKYQGYIGYPLYGFPDIIKLDTFIHWLFRPIIYVDNFISSIPFLNKLGFAVMIKGSK